MGYEIVFKFLFYDIFLPQSTENKNLPKQKKTEEQIFEHIEQFTDDLLRETYPGLSALNPYKDIAAMLIDECKFNIKKEMKRKNLQGLVEYRDVSLEKRQRFFIESFQFALWEVCGLAVEGHMARLNAPCLDGNEGCFV